MTPVFVFAVMIFMSLQSTMISTNPAKVGGSSVERIFEKVSSTLAAGQMAKRDNIDVESSSLDNRRDLSELDLICLPRRPLIEPLIAAGLVGNSRLPLKLHEIADAGPKKEINLMCMQVEGPEEYHCKQSIRDDDDSQEDLSWDYTFS